MTSISVSHCYLYRTCLSLSLRNLPTLIFHHSLAYLSLATSLECCNSYTEIVSPLTFWLLIFANSQFLVNYKISSVSCASQSCGFFEESDRTIMIGWVSQEGKSVSPDQLLSREPPCFHGVMTYLTIISPFPPYFPGRATPISSPDSHLGPLCLLFSSKKFLLPLSSKTPSRIVSSSPSYLCSFIILLALRSCISTFGLICVFWTLLHLSFFMVSFLNLPTPLSEEILLSLSQWFPVWRELFFQEMFGNEWRCICVTTCGIGCYCLLLTRDQGSCSTFYNVQSRYPWQTTQPKISLGP